MVPLRKDGPLSPAPNQGVVSSFGVDLGAYEVIWRNPDGTIDRTKIDRDDGG